MVEYQKQFLSESKENLESFRKNLDHIEDPDNEYPISEIFRAVHTLKGNSHMMGYKKFAGLAHSIEDVLQQIKNNRLKPEVARDVFDDAYDNLEEGLDLIEESGNDVELDTAPVTKRLMDLITAPERQEAPLVEHMILNSHDWDNINQAKAQDKNIFRIIAIFEDACEIKFAKALILLRELSSKVEIMKSNPTEDEIKSGKIGHMIELIIITDMSQEEIGPLTSKFSGFQKIDTLTLEAKYEKIIEDDAKRRIHEKSLDTLKKVRSVRIDISRLDALMNIVGELLVKNSQIKGLASASGSKELRISAEGLDKLVMEIQEEVMDQRMIPIGMVFNRFPHITRELAKRENKKIQVVITGSDIEFDRTVLDEIGEPLLHIIRNSVDHGIETLEERKNKGKPEIGRIYLAASRKRESAVVDIIDDGAGIDWKKVKQAAITSGLIQDVELSDNELKNLIFKPGLSTTKQVTAVSGRGVGLDIVATKVKGLGGTVSVTSTPGEGTKISLAIPYTLAIVDALLVSIGQETYGIQVSQIEKILKVRKSDIRTIRGNETFILHDEDIPIVNLSQELGLGSQVDDYTVLLAQKDNSKIGFVVDEVQSQQQILIKPIDTMKVTGISGAMILTSGEVGLMLDVMAFG